MPEPNVTTISEAAKEKRCVRQTIYSAIERGDLNTTQIGKMRMVLKDAQYDAFEVRETGGRTHRNYDKNVAE